MALITAASVGIRALVFAKQRHIYVVVFVVVIIIIIIILTLFLTVSYQVAVFW